MFPELLLSVLESITSPDGAQIKLFCYLVVATWNSKSYIQELDFKFSYRDRKKTKKNQMAERGLSPLREHLIDQILRLRFYPQRPKGCELFPSYKWLLYRLWKWLSLCLLSCSHCFHQCTTVGKAEGKLFFGSHSSFG